MTEMFESSYKMLNLALEKEERGRDFYKDAVSRCSTELGKEMFRNLMADEGIHIKRVKLIYESLQKGQPWSAQWKSHKVENEDLQKLVRDRMLKLGSKVKSDSGDLDALKIGLEMEQGAVNFYEEQLEKSTDHLERDFITCMIAEERSHYAALQDVKLYLEDPESWFSEKERSTLDGA